MSKPAEMTETEWFRCKNNFLRAVDQAEAGFIEAWQELPPSCLVNGVTDLLDKADYARAHDCDDIFADYRLAAYGLGHLIAIMHIENEE